MDVPDIGPGLKVGPMLGAVLIPCFRRSFERDVIAVAEGHRSEVHVQGTRGSEAMRQTMGELRDAPSDRWATVGRSPQADSPVGAGCWTSFPTASCSIIINHFDKAIKIELLCGSIGTPVGRSLWHNQIIISPTVHWHAMLVKCCNQLVTEA